MNTQISSNNHSYNEVIDGFINWFITKVVKCSDTNNVEKDYPALAALCEFIIFNECIKRPFFNVMDESLMDGKLGRLYVELSKKIKEDDKRIDYAGVFAFLQLMAEDGQKTILNGSNFDPFQQQNILKAIKSDDYGGFMSALGNKDCDIMLKVLSKMQYLFMGTTKSLPLTGNNPNTLSNDRFASSLWNNYGGFCNLIKAYIKYGEFGAMAAIAFSKNNSYEKTMDILRTMLAEYQKENDALNIVTSTKVYGCGSCYSGWETAFNSQTSSVSSIVKGEVDLEFLNGVCDRCAYYIMRDLLKGIIRPLTEYNVAPNTYFDDCSWYDTMKETFGTDNCIEMLGIGISIYTQKMRGVYSEEVKRIIETETRDLLESLLEFNTAMQSYSYTTGIPANSKVSSSGNHSNNINSQNQPEEDNDEYWPELLKGWLRDEDVQDWLCKKYLYKSFENKIDDIPFIKYVFFGKGVKPKDKLIYKGKKGDILDFVRCQNRGGGGQELWDYYNKFIVDKKGKNVFADNPASIKKYVHDEMLRILKGVLPGNLYDKVVEECSVKK